LVIFLGYFTKTLIKAHVSVFVESIKNIEKTTFSGFFNKRMLITLRISLFFCKKP